MAIVFPASPSVNDTFTAGSITYKWDGDKWIGLGVTPADRLVEGSNSLELDANNDLVYTAPGTLKVNSADASGYIAEFNQTNASNSGQILLNSPTDGNSRPSLMDFARGGTVKFSVGMGYNDANNGFLISAGGSLASNINNAVFRITPDGKTGIGNYAANGTETPTSLLQVHTNWDNGDVPMVHFVGCNNEAPQSGTQNISFQISDENSNVLHKIWNTGGGNSDFGNVYYAGNLGVGAIDPNARLEVRTTSGTSEVLRVEGSYTAGNQVVLQRWQRAGGAVSSRMMYNDATTSMRFGTATSHSLQYETNGQERFRVTNVGDIYFGESAGYSGSAWAKTTGISTMSWYRDPDGTAAGALAVANNANTGYSNLYLNKYDWQSGDDDRWISFYLNGSIVEAIRYNGSQIVYNTGSDYRLKENVTEFSNAAEKVNQLRVCEFDWVDNPNSTRTVGFLAHELQEVFPQAVSGTKDATRTDEEGNEIPDYQGVDYGKLTPLLAAALQEALAEIETLKGRLDAAGL